MKYSLKGFKPVTTIQGLGLVYLEQAAVEIAAGDAIFDNGSGYATNVGTAFAATFRGIAAEDSDLSAGSDGDDKIAIIPASADIRYMVKNESGTAAAQTDIGELVDLESNDGVDVTDVTLVEWGFLIDEIDISALAVAANTPGFVIGRFQKTPQ